MILESLNTLNYAATTVVLAQQQQGGPLGPEFGKASPIGWLVIVASMAAILFLGWRFHRRFSRYNRRLLFAQEHGLDVFDEAAVDQAMAEAGVLDRRKKSWL
ncbi:hypothetical protein COCCU_04625 [Corynebacterium occultum]|uniref:Uncharacterized protein n=1 Tax=Corynebacterium occultum TaxID=2675219 RepID=A0A6B8W317_9CORY|nr:hypothetical protein [Corynebacterium occultum]QGU06871.1 hypothetical protein COCCU_04625 [Corynebacterium occultum]